MNNWISVNDRLPFEAEEDDYDYKCIIVNATDGKTVRPMYYEHICVRGKMTNRWKWIFDRVYEGKPITHWMPLPEPPKGE